jgi:hypothetical protein
LQLQLQLQFSSHSPLLWRLLHLRRRNRRRGGLRLQLLVRMFLLMCSQMT